MKEHPFIATDEYSGSAQGLWNSIRLDFEVSNLSSHFSPIELGQRIACVYEFLISDEMSFDEKSCFFWHLDCTILDWHLVWHPVNHYCSLFLILC